METKCTQPQKTIRTSDPCDAIIKRTHQSCPLLALFGGRGERAGLQCQNQHQPSFCAKINKDWSTRAKVIAWKRSVHRHTRTLKTTPISCRYTIALRSYKKIDCPTVHSYTSWYYFYNKCFLVVTYKIQCLLIFLILVTIWFFIAVVVLVFCLRFPRPGWHHI